MIDSFNRVWRLAASSAHLSNIRCLTGINLWLWRRVLQKSALKSSPSSFSSARYFTVSWRLLGYRFTSSRCYWNFIITTGSWLSSVHCTHHLLVGWRWAGRCDRTLFFSWATCSWFPSPRRKIWSRWMKWCRLIRITNAIEKYTLN